MAPTDAARIIDAMSSARSAIANRRPLVRRPDNFLGRVTETMSALDFLIASAASGDPGERIGVAPIYPSPAAMQLYLLSDPTALGEFAYQSNPQADFSSLRQMRDALVRAGVWLGDLPTDSANGKFGMREEFLYVDKIIVYTTAYRLTAMIPNRELTNKLMSRVAARWGKSNASQASRVRRRLNSANSDLSLWYTKHRNVLNNDRGLRQRNAAAADNALEASIGRGKSATRKITQLIVKEFTLVVSELTRTVMPSFSNLLDARKRAAAATSSNLGGTRSERTTNGPATLLSTPVLGSAKSADSARGSGPLLLLSKKGTDRADDSDSSSDSTTVKIDSEDSSDGSAPDAQADDDSSSSSSDAAPDVANPFKLADK